MGVLAKFSGVYYSRTPVNGSSDNLREPLGWDARNVTHWKNGYQLPVLYTQPSTKARIVNIWNSLSNFVVDVDTVCLFKARLDKFWMHQDVIYDFVADLTGIGDRSVRESS